MTAVLQQSSICVMQCVVRSIDAHAEPESTKTTMSMALMTCFARALMDHYVPQAPDVTADDVPSPHWVRVLDLPVLHRSFVI
jgi:hypothetical protein